MEGNRARVDLSAALRTVPPSHVVLRRLRPHQRSVDQRLHVSKVHVEAANVDPRVLYPRRNLVVNDRVAVLADNVDSELKHILGAQLVGLALLVLLRQALAIDPGAVRGLDVANPDLARVPVGPDLGVLA